MGSVEVAYKKHDWVGNTFMVAGRCGLLTNRRAEQTMAAAELGDLTELFPINYTIIIHSKYFPDSD